MSSGAELRKRLSEEAEAGEYTLIFYDGFDDALLGVVQQFTHDPVTCYDYDKCLDVLMHRDGMSYEAAMDFFEFNTTGAWVGEATPYFLSRPLEE